ncbi:hypothetical protein GEOBRER4_n1263 [Citrifermentans bremense]|uniref:HicB family protein n=1 Tax=Citrifermentans bremense TaxID=60035 RepID=A0A6S6LWQ5_9BACT|nr:type II toxin-antitoxin system HicB family antitoxin [Citrifermentans bremense]BCG46467.1 hypothetical protein GEOBRER4_n1263 [Citrifermentans bremense]
MMNDIFEYQGYSGSIQISVKDNCLFGKILFINDVITYEADNIKELKNEFISAVNDYIETCKEIGKEPDHPFKGSFNVRVKSELHRKASIRAFTEKISLNELVSKSIETYLTNTNNTVIEHHSHTHNHYHSEQKSMPFTFSSGGDEWTAKNISARMSH